MEVEQSIALPPPLQDLSTLIDSKEEYLAIASNDLQDVALRATKYVFDWAVQTEVLSWPHIARLFESLTDAAPPQTRSSTKRKQTPEPSEQPLKKKSRISLLDTPIQTLFVDGMTTDQVWEQLDLRGARVCENLRVLDGEAEDGDDDEEGEFRMDDSDEYEPDSDSEGQEEEEDDDSSLRDEEVTAQLRDESCQEEDEIDGVGTGEEDDPPSSMFDVIRKKAKPAASKAGAHSELDDDFFDLEEFNAEMEAMEARSAFKRRPHHDSDSEDSDDLESDVNLFEAVDDSEGDDDDMTGECFYKDFFDAPKSSGSWRALNEPKQTTVRFHDQVKVKKIKAKGKGLPVSTMMYEEEDDEDDEDYKPTDDYLEDSDVDESDTEEVLLQKDSDGEEEEEEEKGEEENGGKNRTTIERMKDDLFAEDEEEQIDPNMTTHERRMVALRGQIRQLEAENVAKKEWVLMGEASSKSRPQDSLLQEDLEFERIAKAVPIVTPEVVSGLEARIKTRIKEGRFDDVVRQRPMDDKPFLPSRFFELQDTKSQHSLAQIYENEYTATQAGTTVDDRDGKLKKEHEELTKVWEGICNKLDALCNAHYVPKQPNVTISTVSDAPAVTLESALPLTKSVSSMLAPEEVFAPASSDPRMRSELTPAEKRALREKERKSRKRARDVLERSVDKYARAKGTKGVKKQKEAALKGLTKSGRGVTVIGKQSKRQGRRPAGVDNSSSSVSTRSV